MFNLFAVYYSSSKGVKSSVQPSPGLDNINYDNNYTIEANANAGQPQEAHYQPIELESTDEVTPYEVPVHIKTNSRS